ncbi:MAG: cation diffusion facilitator family transporter [Thermoplasmatota archaeon]
MARLELPLPAGLECQDCLEELHRRLAAVPSVVLATVDAGSRRAVVESDAEGPAREELEAMVRGALAAPSGHAHHGHLHATVENRRRLGIAFVAGALVMGVEFVAGRIANSLVLIADAGHYLMDLASIGLALFAVAWSLKPATHRKTFGYQRGEVLSAFVQAMGLWILTLLFLWNALVRLVHPPPVAGPLLLATGAFTLVTNAALALFLHRGSGHNLNVRGAYFHVLGDLLGSAAAVVAGAVVLTTRWNEADPAMTVVATLPMIVLAWRLSRQCLNILLEGTPSNLDAVQIEAALRDVQGVASVHDLHIWSHSPGVDSLTAHVVLDATPTDDRVAHAIHDVVQKRFNVHHITVQVESPDCPCDTLQHAWA